MFCFHEHIRCFQTWTLLFDVLQILHSSVLHFPILGAVADAGGPPYGVFEDNFEDAVGAALARFFIGECAWNALVEEAGLCEDIWQVYHVEYFEWWS